MASDDATLLHAGSVRGTISDSGGGDDERAVDDDAALLGDDQHTAALLAPARSQLAAQLRGTLDALRLELFHERGAAQVLVCTATLAWGVNMPAHAGARQPAAALLARARAWRVARAQC